MKKLLMVVLFLIIAQPNLYSQTPVVQSVINETNIDSLIFFVEELSGEVQTIIDYIKQKLDSYGLTTFNQNWSSTGRNVYGVQTGTDFPNQQYIICAHYDDTPPGSTAPGADDNASGTAAVLEAARIFTQYQSKYTIIYALWDEEEQGLVGSAYYAQQAALAGDSIRGVINLDMIAWDSDNDDFAEIHTRSVGNSYDIKDKMVDVNATYSIGLTLQINDPGTTLSDHASFWSNGYGAVLLIEDWQDFNPYYHTTNDKVQYFNQPYYHKMSRLALGTVATLAEITDNIPVELASFSAVALNDGVKLEWTTASELNNNGFKIERSLNNQAEFVTIGFVEGNGTTTATNNYSYTDRLELAGTRSVFYRLKQIDYDGTFSYSNVVSIDVNIPNGFVLNQNYPNPFNPSTKISYSVVSDVFVSLKVYDFLGREVTALVNETKVPGIYEVIFDASNLPSGTYFYTLSAGDYVSTKKMILLR
jgi:hypothetical protein